MAVGKRIYLKRHMPDKEVIPIFDQGIKNTGFYRRVGKRRIFDMTKKTF